MYEKEIVCSSCGQKYPLDRIIFRCGKCGGSLEVVFDYSKLRKLRGRFGKRPFTHSRWIEMYPARKLVSSQEGGTPLVRSKNIEKGLGFRVWFKLESQNPTDSFKDRGSSVEVARALEFGSRRVVCASTGNMGASVAAYSSMSNLECTIIAPRGAAAVKMEQILSYGARLYQVPGDYTMAANLAERAFREHGAYLLGDYLYRREGTKSVGYEILEKLSPDWIFSPVGNGTLISAVQKSVLEFRTLGLSRARPKLAGIQALNCSPVTRSFLTGKPIRPVSGETIAKAIECGSPLDGDRALKAIVDSKGFAESVTDREILRARDLLSRKEGLSAEPAGAVSLAGLLKARDRIEKGSDVVCLVTGHGLKYSMSGKPGKPKPLTLKTLSRAFG
jgi:threonine synthase